MSQSGQLAGKRVLVTGAGTTGIGRSIALELASRGADICVHGRTRAPAQLTTASLTGFGVRVFALAADISTMGAGRALVQEANECMGGLDVVIANTGITQRKAVLDLTDEDMQRVLGINLIAAMALTQEAAKAMVRSGGGSIVIVSSINEDRVIPERAHYCASKGGLRQWGRALAAAAGPSGVRVNLLCPSAIDTPMNQPYLAQHPERLEAVLNRTPLRRLREPADIACAAAFLAGDDSRFMTGASLSVDGGLSLG
jgi:NAD(P)-dependent dehydrogenase (short-subunit alcohol dehydrogenase family)